MVPKQGQTLFMHQTLGTGRVRRRGKQILSAEGSPGAYGTMHRLAVLREQPKKRSSERSSPRLHGCGPSALHTVKRLSAARPFSKQGCGPRCIVHSCQGASGSSRGIGFWSSARSVRSYSPYRDGTAAAPASARRQRISTQCAASSRRPWPLEASPGRGAARAPASPGA